jgi:hypothetical protein
MQPNSRQSAYDLNGYAPLAFKAMGLAAFGAPIAWGCGFAVASTNSPSILPIITEERICFVDCSRIPHDIETGDQFHIAWGTAPACHADALGLVGAGILRPVFREHILCLAFIAHARRLVASIADGASGRRVATWTGVQFRRAVGDRKSDLRPERYDDQCDPDGESDHGDSHLK